MPSTTRSVGIEPPASLVKVVYRSIRLPSWCDTCPPIIWVGSQSWWAPGQPFILSSSKKQPRNTCVRTQWRQATHLPITMEEILLRTTNTFHVTFFWQLSNQNVRTVLCFLLFLFFQSSPRKFKHFHIFQLCLTRVQLQLGQFMIV